MSTPIFEIQKRDLNISAHKRRKEGMVPCVIFARDLKPSIPIELSYRTALDLFKVVRKGAAIDLKLGDTIHSCVLASFDFDHCTSTLQHIDFYRPN